MLRPAELPVPTGRRSLRSLRRLNRALGDQEVTPKVADFFVSYNKEDHSWAEWIAWQLEEANYTTVLQEWDFRPGCNFVLEM